MPKKLQNPVGVNPEIKNNNLRFSFLLKNETLTYILMDELDEITMRVKTTGRLDEEELKLLQNLQNRLKSDVNQLTEQIEALTAIRIERQLRLDATNCLLKPTAPSEASGADSSTSATGEHQAKFTRKEKDAAITKAIDTVAKPFTSTVIREYLAENNPVILQKFGKTYIANNLAKREKKGQIKRVGDTKDGYAIKYVISK